MAAVGSPPRILAVWDTAATATFERERPAHGYPLDCTTVFTMEMDEQRALEKAFAYENGGTILQSDEPVKKEPNLHRPRRTAQRDEPAKKKKRRKVRAWDAPKRKPKRVVNQVAVAGTKRDASLTPLAELEQDLELDEDIEGEVDDGNQQSDSDETLEVVATTSRYSAEEKGKSRKVDAQNDMKQPVRRRDSASPISISSKSSPDDASWLDASTSTDMTPGTSAVSAPLQLRPPVARGASIPPRDRPYPSPATSVEGEGRPSSAVTTGSTSTAFPASLAVYSSLFAAAGIHSAGRLWQLVPPAHAERFVCDFLVKACKGGLTVDRQFRLLQEMKRHCPATAKPLGLQHFSRFLHAAGVKDAAHLVESIRHAEGDVKAYLDFLVQHTPQRLTLAERFALQIAIEEACLKLSQ